MDAKKKQLNKLCWPYIEPCGVDNENRVCVFCESIMLEESLDAYKYVLECLFQFDETRTKSSIKMIYSDMFINESLLRSVGLSASLFYDQYHLINSVWKKYLHKYMITSIIIYTKC